MNNRHKTNANFGFRVGFMVVLLSVCKSLVAADWTVEQRAVLSSPEVRLSQENSTSSHQAINGVMLELTTDSLTESTQDVTINGAQLTLTQSGSATNSNVQAVNLVSANSIDQLTQSTEQTSGSATLTQDITSGTNNIQSINYAAANGNINDARQTFVGQSMTLNKTAITPAGNIQAVNYIEAAGYTGTLAQSVMLDSLDYSNPSGNPEGIRINSINGATGSTDITQQVTIEGELTVDPYSDRTIIINHIAQ